MMAWADPAFLASLAQREASLSGESARICAERVHLAQKERSGSEQKEFSDQPVLVAKSPPPSSNLFHKACKMRERGGVWGNALQPVMYPADIHSGGGHDMLKMGARLANVA